MKNFSDVASFALQILAKICQRTERNDLANECSHMAIKLNPFLWQVFVDLCNRGAKPDPNKIFQLTSTDVFATSQCNNLNYGAYNVNNDFDIMTTPIDQMSNCITPTNNIMNNTMLTLRGGDNLIDFESPTSQQLHPIVITYNNNNNNRTETPFSRKQFKYLSAISPTTPSFGVLPLQSPVSVVNNSNNMNNSSANEKMISPQTLIEINNDKKILNNVKTINIINRKQQSQQQQQPQQQQQQQQMVQDQQQQNLKPTTIFGQHVGNITPRTPISTQNQNQLNSCGSHQNVRRSSRLFSSNNNNYSVKENAKTPNNNKNSNNNINNKFVTPRSPMPRKTKQRITKINLNNELITDNLKSAPDKIETITSTNNVLNNNNNINTILLSIKKQSADGLMSLLKDLGTVYLLMSQYENEEAIKYIESKIPPHHYKTSWVQSLLAVSHHEQRDYETAVKLFQEIHDKEPYRLQYMEIYSTDLWHLQKDVMLSALAQDFLLLNKTSPITWCVAGNCFSAHKEHDTAIKFFQRAIQVDPDFPYSYTLLGHELVMTEELDKALQCYRKAILQDSRHYNAWFGIGTIFSKQERYQLAEIHYRRALAINPKSSVIMVHIGVMQFYLQKTEEALQTLNKAIKIDPKNPLCKFHRGSMYFTMGKHQEALNELEELKQIVPKESVVYYLIGKIHKKLGNIDSALMHLSWATDLGSKGANNQIKDNFDSVIIRSTQDNNNLATTTASTSATSSGGVVRGPNAIASASVSVANTTRTVTPPANITAANTIDLYADDNNLAYEQISDRSDDSLLNVRNDQPIIFSNDYDSDSY